jgi:hypothetical protein
MLPAQEEILSIQLVTNNKYARQVLSCAAGLTRTNGSTYFKTNQFPILNTFVPGK